MDGGIALGRLDWGPYGAPGVFWARPKRSLGSQEAARRKPNRPPNDVGRRLEEETAESRCVQSLSTNIAILYVGRALELTLDT